MISAYELLNRGAIGANNLLRRTGLSVVRHSNSIRDVRQQTGDPIEAAYRAGLSPFVANFELAHCRILPGAAFACAPDCGNPFIDTLVGYRDQKIVGYSRSPLEAFYQAWRPRNAAEVLGLETTHAGSPLSDVQPLGFVMPWNDWLPDAAIRRWTAFIERDNKEHGTRADASLGWKAWGPIDPMIGEQEFSRLTSLCDSINSRGYARHHGPDGDIKGVVLEKDAEFRVLVTAGHHRAAALTVANSVVAPIRIDNQIVRYADSRLWPNVRSGLFSHAQAVALFDRLFEAKQPNAYNPLHRRASLV